MSDDSRGASGASFSVGLWSLAAIVVVAVLTIGLAVMNKGFEISTKWLNVVVSADDEYMAVARLLKGEDDAQDAEDAEALLSKIGYYDLGLEGEPIEGQQTKSLLQTKGYYSVQSDQLFSELEQQGFYHLGDNDLLSAIRRFDVSEFDDDPDTARQEALRMRNDLLDMMGTLKGPFKLEVPELVGDEGLPTAALRDAEALRELGLLWDTSTDFLEALYQLERSLDKVKAAINDPETERAFGVNKQDLKASSFITEFWEALADRRSIFGLTKFDADVMVNSLEQGSDPRIYVCDENAYLSTRDIQIIADFNSPVGFGFTRTYPAVSHPSACFKDRNPELAEALAGRHVPIVINEIAAREMFGDDSPHVRTGLVFEATATLSPGTSTHTNVASAEGMAR